MLNRNGTIKRLQDSLEVVNGWCRTDSLDDPIANVERAMEDALELLKQEHIKPMFVGNDEWQCPKCETVVGWKELDCSGITETKYKYCPECGRRIAWE